jgi:hypothetical protein
MLSGVGTVSRGSRRRRAATRLDGEDPGARSDEGVRDRAQIIEIARVPLRVASMPDIIKSKRAVLEILERSLEEGRSAARPTRRARARK